MLRVSLNEIFRTCQRALEGLGAPIGVDRESAAFVAWLEARGLSGLKFLARDLPLLEGGFGPIAAGNEIDVNGRSAIAYAGAIIDYLQSLAEPGSNATLMLRNVRSPIFLLPAASARAALGERYCLQFGDGERLACATLLDQSGVNVYLVGGALPDVLTDRAATVNLATGPKTVVPPDGLNQFLTLALLQERTDHALANGVTVDDESWLAIAAVAARVLVPATAQSRARGAGGGDANE